MEEDIKKIEEIINWLKDSSYPYDISLTRDDIQSLENLIKGYRELKEENEDLKNDLHHDGLAHKYLTLKATSIPKSKIKEKIEELNDYYKNKVYPTKYQWADIDITEFYDNQIGLLQELMEEK